MQVTAPVVGVRAAAKVALASPVACVDFRAGGNTLTMLKGSFDLPVRFVLGATFAFALTGVPAVTFLCRSVTIACNWQTAPVSSGAIFTSGDEPPGKT